MRNKISLTPEQERELKHLSRHSPMAHIRIKALAVYNVGQGIHRHQVAQYLGVERRSVGRWVRNYLADGVSAFAIKAGRGRRPKVKKEEVEDYLRQSPRQFGIPRTRWTLALLGQVVPSLRGMGESGIRKALGRLGYSYKRGQPTVHSPDPQYTPKRGLWCRP
jgi:transposase